MKTHHIDLLTPTVHINGSDHTDLARQWIRFRRAVEDLPLPELHDRDYYVSKDFAGTLEAREEFLGIIRELLRVSDAVSKKLTNNLIGKAK